MAAAFALAIIRGNNIFIFVSPKRLRSFRRYFFQGKSCNGNRHRSTQFIAQATFKSAKHKKSFSVATWIFCMEPFCFGIIKGEQPLIRASRASKVAGAFLVLFCARKRVHTRRRCTLQKALNFKHATTLCAENLYFSTFRLCRVQNSFAGCRLRAGLCQRPGGGTGS